MAGDTALVFMTGAYEQVWGNGCTRYLLTLTWLNLRVLAEKYVPTGSSSRGGNVTVYLFNINQPSLPTPFYSVMVSFSVSMALSTVFHSINSPDNSPFSHSVLPVFYLCLIGPFSCISLYGSLLQPCYNPMWLTGLN